MSRPTAEDVAAMVAWARSRIEHCRRAEANPNPHRLALTAAQTERRALTAVLEQLGVKTIEQIDAKVTK